MTTIGFIGAGHTGGRFLWQDPADPADGSVLGGEQRGDSDLGLCGGGQYGGQPRDGR